MIPHQKSDDYYQYGEEIMKLSDLKREDNATILKLETDETLKRRLYSFGIHKGVELRVESCSLAKQTIEILVDGTLIGLRKDEAQMIEVEKIEGV